MGERMSVKFVAILGLIAVLSTSACAASSSPSSSEGGRGLQGASPPRPAAIEAPPAKPAAPAQVRQPAPGGGTAASGAAADPADQLQQNLPSADRMIIRTVNMTIAVGNVQEVFRQVEQLAGEQRGYISGSQIRQDGDRLTATLTIRVPADHPTFQATLERLRGLSERVVDEQSQAQDVTEEYVDLDARLRTLKASEETMLGLLSKATRMEDILQIQRELTQVRTQIEQIQGRKQVLERRADLATINLTIREAGAFARPGWSPGSTIEEAIRALGTALRGLVTVAIWLAVFSPIWGGLLVVIYILIRVIARLARRGSRPRMTPQTAPPAAPATPTA
jgi:hypothetical protein